MNLCINLTADNWLKIISLLFATIGGFFIYYQWRKSIKTRRAEFINQILEKLRFDKELPKYMYIIDYNQHWYSQSFHDSDIEASIDKLFSYVDYICYLKATKNISATEFKIFQYEISRICVSNSTKKYLWNLYHFSRKIKSACSFQYLIDYGINSELFPTDFKNNNSLYTKTLNW
ncbi:hypothetical protein [Leeuwenhoekiella sp. LLG6367-2.1]|uniref:hypothetical protein n=1 Tax=Leeuwenhoekiella sp. LLG6367-2.1 TaxID=3160833 RepID=UPI00386EF353